MTSLILLFSIASLISQPDGKLPNFSGTWTEIPGTSQPAGMPPLTPITIRQDSGNVTVLDSSNEQATYRLDGSETQNKKRLGQPEMRSVTSTARWAGSRLILTDRSELWKRETTYSFREDGSGDLVVTLTLTGLYERSGALTVGSIGPNTRYYRKKSGI
ncbi:MAG TPA: hypothetical protein VJN96_06220 [Vicinamibacterales bacterium]|nr:hypothetical protein [Vicinamibacterales bacterium]